MNLSAGKRWWVRREFARKGVGWAHTDGCPDPVVDVVLHEDGDVSVSIRFPSDHVEAVLESEWGRSDG